jgi:Kef-type K+ transport system membrane component KefB
MKESAMISLFNTSIPLIFGFVASRAVLGLDNIASLVVGITLAVTSQAISIDILEEARMLKSKIGSLMITSGTVDDVFELIAISLVLVIFHTALSDETTVIGLLGDIVQFLIIVMIFRVTLIPFAMKTFENDNSQAILLMGALIIVFLMAYLSEIFGISSLIGALIAGILIRQTLAKEYHRKPWRKNEISHLIHAIAFGFLIPIFFVNVGLRVDLSLLSSNIAMVAVFLIVGLLGSVGGTVIGVGLSKGTLQEGLIVGWGVTPKGDTDLVIATLALSKGIITTAVYTSIVTVAIICTFIAPIVFKYLIKNYRPSRQK